MSLINTMLRDLENRRASELGRRDWQREIRALPAARRSFLPLSPRWYVGLAVVTASALFWFSTRSGAPAVTVETLPPPAPLQDLPATALARSTPPSTKNSPMPNGRAGKTESKPDARVDSPGGSVPAPDKAPRPLPEPAFRNQSAAPEEPESRPLTKAERRRQLAEAKAEARAAKERGRLEAGELITKTVNINSGRERAEAEYRRGQALAANGQSAEAVLAWHGALSQDPSYAPARQSLVRVLIEERRHAEAVSLLSEGLDSQPGQIAWAMTLARLLVERQDVAGAAKALARSQGHAGGSADYAGFQGHLAQRLGQYAQAAERYQAAVAVASGEGRWWFGLAQAKEADGKAAEAQDAYRRALACGNLPASLLPLAEQKLR